MDLNTSIDDFIAFKKQYRFDEIENLVKICHSLNVPQKIIGAVTYNFYCARDILWFEPDDVVFYTAIIDLAYKEMDSNKSLDSIIEKCLSHFFIDTTDEELSWYKENIADLQLDFLYRVKCDLDVPKPRELLEKIYKKKKISKPCMEFTSGFLNDTTTYLPCSLFFTPEECTLACIYLATLTNHVDFYGEKYKNEIAKEHKSIFINEFEVEKDTMEAVEFLIEEFVDFYEVNTKQNNKFTNN